MLQHKDFTLNPVNFSQSEMNSFVTNLHNSGKHYGLFIKKKNLFILFTVVIIDPGIKIDNGYTPYTDGVSLNIFIKVHVINCVLILVFVNYRTKMVAYLLVKYGLVLQDFLISLILKQINIGKIK